MDDVILTARELILRLGRDGGFGAPLSFQVNRGQIVGVLGKNGVGKTTLLRAILGDPVSQAGWVIVGDSKAPTIKCPPTVIARWISYLPQEPVFPADLIAGDYLRMSLMRRRSPLQTGDALGVGECGRLLNFSYLLKKTLGSMSAGERQRVHLGRVFLGAAPIVLLDEPTNHLDPGSRGRFWDLVCSGRVLRNTTYFIVTHDTEAVRRYCTGLLALNHNGCVYFGPPEKFFMEKPIERLYDETPAY